MIVDMFHTDQKGIDAGHTKSLINLPTFHLRRCASHHPNCENCATSCLFGMNTCSHP